MDGITKFKLIVELKRELYADGCTDERGLAILAEIRKLEAKPKAKRVRTPKAPRDRFMNVLGGYKLDMDNHGALVREVIDLRTGERYETSSEVEKYDK